NSSPSVFVNTLVAFLTLSQGFLSPVALDEVDGPAHIEIQGPHCVLARSTHIAKMSLQDSQWPTIACDQMCGLTGAHTGRQRDMSTWRKFFIGFYILDDNATPGAQRSCTCRIMFDRDFFEEFQERRIKTLLCHDVQHTASIHKLHVAFVGTHQVN